MQADLGWVAWAGWSGCLGCLCWLCRLGLADLGGAGLEKVGSCVWEVLFWQGMGGLTLWTRLGWLVGLHWAGLAGWSGIRLAGQCSADSPGLGWAGLCFLTCAGHAERRCTAWDFWAGCAWLAGLVMLSWNG